jgi:hypothetical protein
MKILLELGDLQGNSNISVIETDNLRYYDFAKRNRKSVQGNQRDAPSIQFIKN